MSFSFIRRAALAATVLAAASAGGVWAEGEAPTDPGAASLGAGHRTTQQLLDRIDTQDFLSAPIDIASGHNTVKDGFLGTPEVKALLAAPDAVPAMLARLDRPNGLRDFSTRIVYFVVFERLRDRRTLRPLAAYLDGLAAGEAESAGVPADPFQYALDAVQAQMPLGFPPASGTDAPFRARHRIAARIRARLAHGVRRGRP